jgi:protoporphyrinogen/coproporphyrinogen III oxidase
MKLQKEGKKTGKKVGAGPGGALTSFYDGMGTMINTLAEFLGARLKTGVSAQSVDKKDDIYTVYLSDGSHMEAEAVVCATPAFETAAMAKGLDKGLASTLNEIVYPSVSVVCLGYKREKIQYNLDGFGFLIPFREGRKILGTLWDSSVFPNRAPEGYVLLRSMLGGARKSDLADKDEGTLINLVMDELGDIMGIKVQPDFAKVYRHKQGIPQYALGHEKRLEIIDGIITRFRRLYITGNAYRGIGVNDCIEHSSKLAEKILQEI